VTDASATAATAPVVDAAAAETFASRDDYRAAAARVREAAAAYYAGTEPELDDADYDALIARMLATEASRPAWREDDSPTASVGAGAAPVGDVTHAAPMLSLGNVFDADGLHTWAARLDKLVGHPVTQYCVEPKIDGLALSASYVDGRLTQLATRGDGSTGEDVTTQARLIAGLPERLSEPVTLEVRGEVYMTDDDFEVANERRTGHGEPAFANPRSAAAGSVRAQRPYDVPLSFFAYAQRGLDPADAATQSGSMARLEQLGIATTARSAAGLVVCATVDEAMAAIARLGTDRGKLGFGIDGAVIKADHAADRDAAGVGTREPRWGIAYKFPADTRTTTLVGIEVQIGRTGIITPVATLAPVQVGGVTVTSATLHNFADLVIRDVRVGDTVFVRRAGDVIPEITGAKLDVRPDDAVAFAPPEVCPRCGGEIDRSQKRWRCMSGRVCGARESLAYFTSRGAMDIEGLGDKILDLLVTAGHVTDPADLYALDVPTLAALERMGTVSATKLVAAIDDSRSKPLSRVLTGLGVRMTGRSMSRRLARHFGTIEALQAATVERLQEVEGVGPERATTIAAELVELAPLIDRLRERDLTMVEPGVTGPGGSTAGAGATSAAASVDGTDGAPAGATGSMPLIHADGRPMKVVVTGAIPGLTRTEGNEAVEELGGASSGSVSARTDLVVAGDGAGSKAAKAASLGIPIMPSDVFAALLAAHRTGDRDGVAVALATLGGEPAETAAGE